jgi:hypothetical protein
LLLELGPRDARCWASTLTRARIGVARAAGADAEFRVADVTPTRCSLPTRSC